VVLHRLYQGLVLLRAVEHLHAPSTADGGVRYT
jgi:hypothetical protein